MGEKLNRAARRHPENIDWLPGMPKMLRGLAARDAGLPLSAFATRQQRRMEARRRAKAGRSGVQAVGQGGAA